MEIFITGEFIQINFHSYANNMRDDDDIQVTGIPGHSQQKYPIWQTAIKAYTQCYNNNDVVASLEPNSRFWMELIPVSIRSTPRYTSTSAEEAL